MGFPLINITFEPNSGGGSRVIATQSRFLADNSIPYDESESPFR